MVNAESLARVHTHTHTHTGNLIEIKEGRNTFINNTQKADYLNCLCSRQ